MRTVLLVGFVAFSLHHEIACYLPRSKRESAGALDIITNNSHSIHADIQPENSGAGPGNSAKGSENNGPGPKNAAIRSENAETGRNKKCLTMPSSIETGTVFQVTPPKLPPYEIKSFRKSLPGSTRLDLLRGVSRVVTLATLILSAAIEFYPIVYNLYHFAYDFLYYKY